MNKALLILATAAAMLLGGCEPSGPPKPRPHHREPGTLYHRPDCGAPGLRFVHRRICENKSLDYLDRMLQIQWGDARRNADPERMRELDDLQDRFLRERHACEGKDDICIADVYHRYLTPEPTSTPKPKPTWTPRPMPAPAPRPHWTPKPHWTPRPAPEEGPGPDSCAARIGPQGAERLLRMCRRVNQGSGWACSPARSCGQLRGAISRGCNSTYRKPGFCPHL